MSNEQDEFSIRQFGHSRETSRRVYARTSGEHFDIRAHEAREFLETSRKWQDAFVRTSDTQAPARRRRSRNESSGETRNFQLNAVVESTNTQGHTLTIITQALK